MRILVTGAAGQLGRDLVKHCQTRDDEVYAFDRPTLDITNESQVQDVLSNLRPQVVYNCAAWTAVDECESLPERADLINGTAVGFLGRGAESVGAHLVQFSTDYVFDGCKSEAYVESDQPNPQSAYGRSKLRGELAAGPTATIVRTSWVCSAYGGNMVETILRLAESHQTLTFVADQRGNPTFTADLADTARQLAVDQVAGVVHVTNQGTVSWFEFARAVMTAAGLDPARVLPIATAELLPARPAARPTNSALANERLAEMGYTLPRDFHDALRDVIPVYLR